MTGTELKIVTPAETEILGPEVDRLPTLHTKLCAGTIEAADPRELVIKWSAFLATAERGVYFATYRGSFIAPEPSQASACDDLAA